MLLSKHPEETQSSPRLPSVVPSEETAVQERVTAQEFARALASLEAQREQSERSLHDTVPIGEALEQLGLTANAADILAEVQAQRQQQAQEKQATLEAAQQHTQKLRKRRRLGLALAGVLGLGLSGYALSTLSASSTAASETPAYVLPTPAGVAATSATAITELRTLAEVAEGQTVLCKSADLKALIQHPSLSLANVVVQTPDSSLMNGRWAMVKHEGHVYVQGYMAAMSAQVLAQMKSVDLYSSGLDYTQTGGMAYVKAVRVRLDNFAWKSMGSNADIPYLTVTNLHLDRFADVPER